MDFLFFEAKISFDFATTDIHIYQQTVDEKKIRAINRHRLLLLLLLSTLKSFNQFDECLLYYIVWFVRLVFGLSGGYLFIYFSY